MEEQYTENKLKSLIQNCNYPIYSDHLFAIYFWMFFSLSVLYVILFLLISYVRCRYVSHLSPQFKMVYFIAVADLFFISQVFFTPYFSTVYNEGLLCKIQAFLSNASTYSSTIWIGILIFFIYLTTVWRHNRLTLYDTKFIGFSIIAGNLIPVILSILPFLFDSVYGNSGFWCWIRLGCLTSSKSSTIQLVFVILQYAIFWIVALLSLFFYWRIWKTTEAHGDQSDMRAIRILQILPLYLFFYVLFASFNRFQNYLSSDIFYASLALFHVASSYIQKIFVLIVFGLNPSVRQQLCLRCRKRKSPLLQSLRSNN